MLSNPKTYDLPEMTEFLKNEPELETAIAQNGHSSPKLQKPYYLNAGEIKTVVKEALILFAKGELSKEETGRTIIEGCNAAINDYYRANPLD